jgi:hypothetical protein
VESRLACKLQVLGSNLGRSTGRPVSRDFPKPLLANAEVPTRLGNEGLQVAIHNLPHRMALLGAATDSVVTQLFHYPSIRYCGWVMHFARLVGQASRSGVSDRHAASSCHTPLATVPLGKTGRRVSRTSAPN